jgi:predicted AAA+ superfamily ATPase
MTSAEAAKRLGPLIRNQTTTTMLSNVPIRCACPKHAHRPNLPNGFAHNFDQPCPFESAGVPLALAGSAVIKRSANSRRSAAITLSQAELALYYMSNVVTLASFHKLNTSLGLGSVTTVSAYTDFLVQAFVLATVPVYDASVKRRSVAPKKVYAVDTGLANRVSLSFSHNLGALTENMVLLELLRRVADVSYYRTASGREVDFACRRGWALAELVQVTCRLPTRRSARARWRP